MRTWTLAIGSIATLGSLGTLGCGSTTAELPPPSSSPESASTTTASDPAPAEAAPSPAFDVHEWGLVDVPASGPTEIGAGPGQPDQPMSVRKPVIYVHTDEGTAPFSMDVVARFPSGELIEHWPTTSEWHATTTDAASVAWHGVSVGGCASSAGARGPILAQREARACAAIDGYCEVADLPGYVTNDATCLTADGFDATLLFYRGRTSQATLPLSVQRTGTSTTLSASVGGGADVLYVTGGRGVSLPWPAPGASTQLPTAFTESFDGPALARSLARRLIDAGLTSPEADAFLRAWAEPLFQTGWPEGDASAVRDAPTRFRRMPSQPPFVLYVMPESTVPALAELTITPTPRSVRRVMVVRVELAR